MAAANEEPSVFQSKYTEFVEDVLGALPEYTAQIQAAATVQPELFNQLNMLYQKAYEITGVSQLAAASRNPLGANASGAALREMTDIQSDRFALTSFQYQQFHLDLAQLFIDEAKALASIGKTRSFQSLLEKDGT